MIAMFGFFRKRETGPDPWTMIAGVFIIGLFVLTGLLQWQRSGFGKGEVTIGGTTVVRVDVAASDVTRARGLSGRDALGPDQGMLFLFSSPGQYTFWMKGMKFPIDTVWIANGKVVDLTLDTRPPGPGGNTPVYFPRSGADSVLEVPAGFVKSHAVTVGTSVVERVDRRGALR